MADLRIGSSAFTAAGWPRAFYPEGLPERDFLTYYATKFDTVEVDSTFYRTPSKSTVQGWDGKSPVGLLACPDPAVTHDFYWVSHTEHRATLLSNRFKIKDGYLNQGPG